MRILLNESNARKRFVLFMIHVMFITLSLLQAQNNATESAFLRNSSPRWAVKTNIAGWATASLNVAAETRMSPKTTFNLGLSYNPFTYNDNKKWKHILVQPELRYWFCAPFGGHFMGVHLLYSHYNAGGVKMPFGLWSNLENTRYQGDLYGVGVAYGYNWILSPHWNIEATVGAGYGFTHYKHYECRTCGNYKGTENRHLFMPTKLALSFIYIIK